MQNSLPAGADSEAVSASFAKEEIKLGDKQKSVEHQASLK